MTSVLRLRPAAGAIALGLALPALAGAADSAAAGLADEPVRLEKFSVTAATDSPYKGVTGLSATKTETPLRDIPQSIQVVSELVIADQQAIVLEDAVRNVSGVYRDNTFGNTADRFSLRGFSQTVFLRDGYRDQQSQVRNLAGVDRVEVLKGPSSILYGQLEPGGIINLATKRPREQPAVVTDLQFGSDELRRATLDATGPLATGRSVLYRLNASYEDSGTFRQPTSVKIERLDVAPSFTWRIKPDTEVWVQLNYLRSERPFDRGLVATGTGIAAIPYDRFLGEPGDHLFVEQLGFVVELKHRLNRVWRLRQGVRGAWSDSNDYRAEPSAAPTTAGVMNRRFSMNDDDGYALLSQTELTGVFDTGRLAHTVLAGLDLNRNRSGGINGSNPTNVPIDIYHPVYGAAPLPITVLARNDRNTTDALGAFVQDQISLHESLKFLGGVRFDAVDYTARSFLGAGSTRRQSDQSWTPRAGVVWQPAGPLSLFASYSRSFSPVTSGNLVGGEAPRPTTGTQFETGLKADFLAGKLSTTLAAFHLTKQNVTTADPDNTGFVVQTGEVRSRGIEFDVTGRLLPGWDVIASYAFIDAEVTQDNTVPIGSRLASVPRHGASFWSTYRFETGVFKGFGLGAGLFYVGERVGDSGNTFFLPSYVRTDASFFYERGHWRVGLNLRNVFDRDYVAAASSRVRIDPGQPFGIVGSLSLRF